jgi:hypothetical protein
MPLGRVHFFIRQHPLVKRRQHFGIGTTGLRSTDTRRLRASRCIRAAQMAHQRPLKLLIAIVLPHNHPSLERIPRAFLRGFPTTKFGTSARASPQN